MFTLNFKANPAHTNNHFTLLPLTSSQEFSDIGRGGGRAMLRKEIALRHTAALVQHTFTELLPAPLAPAHADYSASAAQVRLKPREPVTFHCESC